MEMRVVIPTKKRNAVLVTGGCGYVGSHVVVELLENGKTVVVLDNLSNAATAVDAKLPPTMVRVKRVVTPDQGDNLHFRNGSYGDKMLLDSIFTEFDVEVVFHLGGMKSVGRSKAVPLIYYRNNVGESLTLFETMVRYGVKKLLFSSSATVYKDVPDEANPLSEESPIGDCSSPYASTKLFLEIMLKDLVASDPEWTVVALRCFNPVGAHKSGILGEDPKVSNNLMAFISQVAIGRRPYLSVYGQDYPTKDGTSVRDYCHVVELAKGHIAVLSALPTLRGYKVINFGSGEGTSVLEVVRAFEKATGVQIPVKMCDRRPGDKGVTVCDPKRACDELGWSASKKVQEMCEDTWRFQQLNPNGYNSPKDI